MMMNSRLFREELERIIETQMKDGAGPSGLLQQISDMMGAQGARFNGNVFKSKSLTSEHYSEGISLNNNRLIVNNILL